MFANRPVIGSYFFMQLQTINELMNSMLMPTRKLEEKTEMATIGLSYSPRTGGAVRNATSLIPQRLSSITLAIAFSGNVHT